MAARGDASTVLVGNGDDFDDMPPPPQDDIFDDPVVPYDDTEQEMAGDGDAATFRSGLGESYAEEEAPNLREDDEDEGGLLDDDAIVVRPSPAASSEANGINGGNSEQRGQGGSSPFESREVWNSRTVNMMRLLQGKLGQNSVLTYQELADGRTRKTVAGCFWEVLQLKSWGRIDIEQDEPYGDIRITASP